jgi:hypothetical protein
MVACLFVGATDVCFIDSADNLYFSFLLPLSINKKTRLTSPLWQEWSKQNFASINNSGWLAALAFVLKYAVCFLLASRE